MVGQRFVIQVPVFLVPVWNVWSMEIIASGKYEGGSFLFAQDLSPFRVGSAKAYPYPRSAGFAVRSLHYFIYGGGHPDDTNTCFGQGADLYPQVPQLADAPDGVGPAATDAVDGHHHQGVAASQAAGEPVPAAALLGAGGTGGADVAVDVVPRRACTPDTWSISPEPSGNSPTPSTNSNERGKPPTTTRTTSSPSPAPSR